MPRPLTFTSEIAATILGARRVGAPLRQCAEAGADVFVAGSAVYGAQDAAAAVDELRALVSRHHC